MKSFLVVCCLLIVVVAVHSYTEREEVDSCFSCYSSDGWRDCKRLERRTDCTNECEGMLCDKCYKFYDIRNSVYRKGCTSKESCDNAGIMLCKSPECQVWCCDGNNCNAASSTMVSLGVVIMMGLATLVNYLY